jgi:hypothetical protein
VTVGTRVRVPEALLRGTFAELRRCGGGKRECQVLWTGPWSSPREITAVIHPRHVARGDGFELKSAWLTDFWNTLTATGTGVRAQIHTHPGRAFHSTTDDAWPIIHTPGFLSLVIPHFAQGEIGLKGAYLTELGADGRWSEINVQALLDVVC